MKIFFLLATAAAVAAASLVGSLSAAATRRVGGGNDTVESILTEELFDAMLKHRNSYACPGRNFYTYDAFVNASSAFPDFGSTGDLETRKREIAAFFGQTSHQTTGGWPTAPDGPYTWGYCNVKEADPLNDYCVPNTEWPCARGKSYYGRGPMQLSYNYNYGAAGDALGLDLLGDPDLVAKDPAVSFRTAIWFWMTPQSPKPSCHDVMIGEWTPTAGDVAAGRKPGYGLTTSIINGGMECGLGPRASQYDRIGFYQRYCELLGVDPGEYLDCDNQSPYPHGLSQQAK